ncbi:MULTISPECIES: DUF3035 domain-containing protein [Roseovarius]|uniref:DUF3035 domain-containing protein n=1 Tax=Roseovarius nubinhibens TaxID=314263 RepID=A0A348WIL1_9RHOB|nr:DUF3035 domain-containing protein [Roseovarius nubinhibens]|tara:strand:- start:3296 stop:3817 length:522 start_codon:yes stop_codon:yes gene_type:complete
MRKSHVIILLTALTVALGGCAKRGEAPKLAHFKKTGNGPDEFTVLPTHPLQTPTSYNALPAPTPGGVNLVDQNPEADGIAALGGNAGALNSTSAAEANLINHARREGATPDIRQTLRTEDNDRRRRYGRVNIFRLGPIDDYTAAYKRQWLDADAEKQRLERRGIATPSAPPAE